MKTESGRGCGFGRGGYRQGDVLASSRGTAGIKRNSPEQIKGIGQRVMPGFSPFFPLGVLLEKKKKTDRVHTRFI
jgi:hypothetical protein